MNQPNANIRHKREKAKMFSYKAASTLLTEVKQSLKKKKKKNIERWLFCSEVEI